MSEPRLRLARVVGFGLLAEVATAIIILIVTTVYSAVFANGNEAAIASFTQRVSAVLGPGLGILFTYVAALYAARPVPRQARAHGVAVGVVTSALTIPGMFAQPAMIPIYAGAIVLKLAAGWTAGAQVEWQASES